jgi:polyhydroxyalkanoate synthesis regulator phasin
MAEEQRGGTGIGEGLRAGIGILTAFKQAIEETIEDAAERNDLRPERAREALSGALTRAQDAFDDVRERLDVVPRRELDALREEIEELRRRVARLEGGGGGTAHALAPGPPPGGTGSAAETAG